MCSNGQSAFVSTAVGQISCQDMTCGARVEKLEVEWRWEEPEKISESATINGERQYISNHSAGCRRMKFPAVQARNRHAEARVRGSLHASRRGRRLRTIQAMQVVRIGWIDSPCRLSRPWWWIGAAVDSPRRCRDEGQRDDGIQQVLTRGRTQVSSPVTGWLQRVEATVGVSRT